MANKESYDIAVIGSGPGGYAAAFRAADLGKKVVLIDRDKDLGGVCLNRGCIPSKALLHISRVINEVEHLSGIGVAFGSPNIDIEAVRSYKERIVSQLNKGIVQLAKVRKVKTLNGLATFLSNTELLVDNGEESKNIEFERCIIAAGSTSSMLPKMPENHPSVLTSRTALELADVPDTLLIVGLSLIHI